MAKVIRLLFLLIIQFLGFHPSMLMAQSDNLPKLEQLARLKIEKNIDSIRTVAIDILKTQEKEESRSVIGETYYYLGYVSLVEGLPDSTQYYFDLSIKEFEAAKDTGWIGNMYFKKGFVYKNMRVLDSALFYFSKSIPFFERASDTTMYGVANDYFGHLLKDMGDYYGALRHYQNSLKAFKELNIMYSVGIQYNSIGLIYREMKEKEREKEAYQNAIDILSQTDKSNYHGEALTNLSELYLDEGKTEEAFKMLEQAKNIFESTEHINGQVAYNAVLSYYYLNLNPPDYDKVIEHAGKGAQLAKENNSFRQYSDACYYVGLAYLKKGNTTIAEKWFLEGYQKAKEFNLTFQQSRISKGLSELFYETRNDRQAYDFLHQYVALNDSLASAEKIREFTSMDLSFKFREQQLSDSLKNTQHRREMEFQHENEIKTQRQLNYFFLIVSLLVISFAVYMVFARRRIHKANLLLAGKNELINNQKTDLEKSNEKLGQAISKLKELDEYKQAMVNMIVHDLKNPLNVLVNIDAFEDKTEQEAIIKYTSKQMLNLIMNMLDVNRAENNTIQLTKSEISFNEIARASMQDVNFLCTQENIEIKNTIAFDFTIDADCDLLTRVFVNFFTNALKFSPANSSIILAAQTDVNGRLEISVKDHGQGIAPENHALIFEKFRQINRVKSGNIGSTGLGLAFCKMAVELHGWEIGVDSSSGNGAKFWIKIGTFKMVEKQNLTLDINKSVKAPDEVFDITNEDFIKLKPYLAALKKHGVFAVSDFKETSIAIENLKIAGLKNWLSELRRCVTNLDEEKFIKLLDVFKR